MNKKQLLIKLIILVVGGISIFLLSSCFTSMRILSCKKSCVESCNSSDDNISGHEYGIYYSLSNSGDFYWVDEVGYKETEVEIPETYEGYPVMKIRSGAFTHYRYGSGCGGGYSMGMSLTSLTLPKTIIAIEDGVFAGYYEHYRAVDPYYREGVRCDKLIYKGTIEDWCNIQFGSSPFTGVNEFYIGGEKVTDLVIPEAVTKIKENAFTYYDGLKSLTLHENITKIEEYAFYGCNNLSDITFPCTNLTIGEFAFSNCLNLVTVTFTGETLILGRGAFGYNPLLKEVEWNTVNITQIPEYAFADCYGLESFVISASVETIGDNAFDGCINIDEVYNLSKLHVGAGSDTNGKVAYYAGIVHTAEGENGYILTEGEYKFVVSDEKTTLFKYVGEGGVLNLPDNLGTDYTIRYSAFENNGTITAVYIPDCVTEIGEKAFYFCDNLQLLSGCKGVLSVKYRAFARCVKLLSVELEAVEEIHGNAFEYCIALKTVKFPKLTKIMGREVFYNCEALESLTLPVSLSQIWQSAFDGCNVALTYEGTLEQWAEVTLSDVTFTEVTVTCSDGEWTGKI